jgi:hypothetical protein
VFGPLILTLLATMPLMHMDALRGNGAILLFLFCRLIHQMYQQETKIVSVTYCSEEDLVLIHQSVRDLVRLCGCGRAGPSRWLAWCWEEVCLLALCWPLQWSVLRLRGACLPLL